MPFTFSHPAIILPLIPFGRKWFSATALVAGSMAPDFEYFINMEMKQVHGHTINGMFYYDLPISLAQCFVFHWFVRDSLIRYFPFPLKRKLLEFEGYNWDQRFRKSWHVIILSAFIGVCSHLFWDSFTHFGRYFVELIPFLQKRSMFLGTEMYNHDIAQVVCSILGGLIIMFSALSVDRNFYLKVSPTSILYMLLVFIIMILTIFIRNVEDVSDLIATSIAGMLLGLVIAPIIIKFLKVEETGKVLDKSQNQEF